MLTGRLSCAGSPLTTEQDFKIYIYKNRVLLSLFLGLGDFKHPNARSTYWQNEYVTQDIGDLTTIRLIYNSITNAPRRSAPTFHDLAGFIEAGAYVDVETLLPAAVKNAIQTGTGFQRCQSAYCPHIATVVVSSCSWVRTVCPDHFDLLLNYCEDVPYSITPVTCTHNTALCLADYVPIRYILDTSPNYPIPIHNPATMGLLNLRLSDEEGEGEEPQDEFI